ncbi:MAG: HEAT repeat domain-containing protein, partial [Pseudomonadota bacterium]
IFKHEGREVFRQKVPDFLADPGRSLERFSRQTDRQRLTRRVVWYSLLFGLPVSTYITLMVLIQAVLVVFIRPAWALTLSGLIVLALGLYYMVPLVGGGSQVPPGADLAKLIRSESAGDRISAFRDIIRHKREITDLAGYQDILGSPHIADRYYLAQALGQSRQPETFQLMLKLADDPQLNVVCMALSSLGKRRDTMAAPVILNKLRTSPDWYIQWYAYQALRALGWVQAR